MRLAIGRGLLAVVAVASSACGDKDAALVPPVSETAAKACSPVSERTPVEYAGVTADGRYVVVLRAGISNERRIFLGTPERMTEGRITQRDVGCATNFAFEVAGASYGAKFAGAQCNGPSLFASADASPSGTGGMQDMKPFVLVGAPSDAGAPVPVAETFAYTCF